MRQNPTLTGDVPKDAEIGLIADPDWISCVALAPGSRDPHIRIEGKVEMDPGNNLHGPSIAVTEPDPVAMTHETLG